MALVFKYRGITITVKTRDHQPAHVHVESAQYGVKVDISGKQPAIILPSKKSRIKTTEAFNCEAVRLVSENLQRCREVGSTYHGEI